MEVSDDGAGKITLKNIGPFPVTSSSQMYNIKGRIYISSDVADGNFGTI